MYFQYKVVIILIIFMITTLGVSIKSATTSKFLLNYQNISSIEILDTLLNKSTNYMFQMTLRYQHKENNSIFLYDKKGHSIELEYKKYKWDLDSFSKVNDLIQGEFYLFFFVIIDKKRKLFLETKRKFLLKNKKSNSHRIGLLKEIKNQYLKQIRF